MSDPEIASSREKDLATLKERYDIAREHFRHEDGLVSQRVTWFLAFQGLLFTALMTAFGLLDPAKRFTAHQLLFVQVTLVLIMVLGAGSSLVGHRLVRAAYWHMDAIAKWWNGQLKLAVPEDRACFPSVRGTGTKPNEEESAATPKITAAAMFLVLAGIWGVLLIAYLHVLFLG